MCIKYRLFIINIIGIYSTEQVFALGVLLHFSSRNRFINKFAICTSLYIFSQWQRNQSHCFFVLRYNTFFIDKYRRLTVVYISMNNINRRLLSLYNIYYLYKHFRYMYKFECYAILCSTLKLKIYLYFLPSSRCCIWFTFIYYLVGWLKNTAAARVNDMPVVCFSILFRNRFINKFAICTSLQIHFLVAILSFIVNCQYM